MLRAVGTSISIEMRDRLTGSNCKRMCLRYAHSSHLFRQTAIYWTAHIALNKTSLL